MDTVTRTLLPLEIRDGIDRLQDEADRGNLDPSTLTTLAHDLLDMHASLCVKPKAACQGSAPATDTGHTAGQFEGHTPGPLVVEESLYTGNLLLSVADGGEVIAKYDKEHFADAMLHKSAPSLLARAEAAEARVRVLEAALGELIQVCKDACNLHDGSFIPGAAIARELIPARAALAATGVQR